MKKPIKILSFIFGGLISLFFLFLSVGLISFGNTDDENKTILNNNLTNLNNTDEENKINNISNLKEGECIKLSNGKSACLIKKNVSVAGGEIRNFSLSLSN